MTIVNNGTNKYTSILNVTDSLPAGLAFNSTINVSGADFVVLSGVGVVHEVVGGKDVYYLVDGQKVTWRITNITGKSNATITVRVKVVGLGDNIIRNATFIANNVTNDSAVKYVGNLTNNLTVVGPNGTENTTSLTVYPVPIVDISVNITSDKDEYFVDDVAVWTVVVSNANNATNATNVTLGDLFPSEHFEITDFSAPAGTEYNKTTGVWTIGNLNNGTNVTLVINSVAKHEGDDIPYNASVSCNETEWNFTNNKAKKLVDVIPYPVKTVNNDTPYYHEEVLYNLTVVNTGADNYTDVLTVIDSLPAGLEFVRTVNVIGAVKVSEDQNGRVITWKLTNISTNNATIVVQNCKLYN